MGRLLNIVGNLGVGKTTLAEQLAPRLGAQIDYESPTARPFQRLFSQDKTRWALANQLDFLQFRAAQERLARARPGVTFHDGGLDQDFWVFCHLIRAAGQLAAAEFDLCEAHYRLYRALLPPPDLTIYIAAPVAVIRARRQARGRPNDNNIIPLAKLDQFQALIENWLGANWSTPVLTFDASAPSFWSEAAVADLAEQVRSCFETIGVENGPRINTD